MQCSLFGKLPARRDFVAIGAPREFLNAWEPWLQSAISSSRHELGRDWQAAFLAAPIWRFWLGADICGRNVIGAFMSSLDGVGRYFPLTLFACADDDAAIAPPELDSQDDWFDTAERFLLSTLDHDANFEEITARIDNWSPPNQEASAESLAQTTVLSTEGKAFSEVFRSIRSRAHHRIFAGSTFWWTIGGDGFPPVALCGKHMPNPYVFSAMLTGAFARPT
jgi:type VI secretion system protein ImpM